MVKIRVTPGGIFFISFLDMDGVNFELSPRSISDAAATEERNFVFVVGGVEYACCRFQASFVSGLVRRLLASDCCLSRVCLQVKDEDHNFEDVVNLMNGRSISITPVNAPFLAACARELENDELLERIVGFQLDSEAVSMSNVVHRLRIKRELHSDCNNELDFVASHLFETSLDFLSRLSVADLELVLTNPLLKILSEDQLYDTILSLVSEKGDDFLVLLRYVDMVFLSESKLSEFLERIFPDLIEYVWAPLCEYVRRFCVSSAKENLRKAERYRPETFTSANGAFNGIIQRLRDACRGNPHEKGVIAITASSTWLTPCHRVIDYGSNGESWTSVNERNSFVQFDFKSRRVCLTGYSLMSHSGNSNFFVSWAIEVSNDGLTWEAVDERNTRDLVGPRIVRTYECNKRSDRLVRFVRMRLNGNSSDGLHVLSLSQIEFFGRITSLSA